MPGEPEEIEEEDIKPEKQDWAPIDVSHGRFKNPEIFKRGQLRKHLNDELRGVIKDASDRKDTISELSPLSHGGFSKHEMKKKLRELKNQNKLTPLQEKKLRRKFGAF